MRIAEPQLVVGINGNIGSALYNQLQQGFLENKKQLWGTTHKEPILTPQVFYLNLADAPTAWVFPKVHFKVAYLCAGICRMALCEQDPQGTQAININGMRALIERLVAAGTFIIYLSTNQVFSGDVAFAAENTAYQPLNEYGRQKAQMESWMMQHCPAVAIVRLTKVITPEMKLIRDWIDQLLAYQTITAFTDMMLAPVTLSQVLEVLIELGTKKKTGIYHLSGMEDLSYYQTALFLAERLKRPLSLVQPVSAQEQGIQKSFLPRFTSLACSSTIAECAFAPLSMMKVIEQNFNFAKSSLR